MKFLRNYEIRIKSPAGKQYTIAPPFSATFDVDRSVMSTVNNAKVTLFNLAPNTRNSIYKDKYSFTEYWQMFILAGYGQNELYEIFRGNIQEAFSYKKGTEWITEITGYDGAYAIQNGFVAETVNKDVSFRDTIDRVIRTMPEVLPGVLGSTVDTKTSERGQVVIGNSYDVLQGMTDGQVFIDGERVNILKPDEVMAGKAFVLDGGDGGVLLETPRRREQFLEVNCLFSPEIRVGYICEIRSAQQKYNGQYKVYGIKHNVTVSGAQGGDARSMISLYTGAAQLSEVR
jgi:hypothetical protein